MSSSPTRAAFLYKPKKKLICFKVVLFFLHNRMASFIKNSAKQNIQSEMYEGMKMRVTFLTQTRTPTVLSLALSYSFPSGPILYKVNPD